MLLKKKRRKEKNGYRLMIMAVNNLEEKYRI